MTSPSRAGFRPQVRAEDMGQAQQLRRPLNDALLSLSTRLDDLPRRQQVWLRFDLPVVSTAPLNVAAPPYVVGAMLVMNVLNEAGGGSLVTAAPWLSFVQSQDGSIIAVTAAYGFAATGSPAVLVEFVEDVSGGFVRG